MDDDPVFRAELLSTFFHESIQHMLTMLGACKSFSAGGNQHTFVAAGGPLTRPVEQVIKDEAHAIKGSAATLELEGAAEAAAGVEDPAKQMVACLGGMSAEDRAMLLGAFCLEPATELRALVREVRAAASFFISWMSSKASSDGIDFASAMEASEGERLHLVSLEHFDEQVTRPFAALWNTTAEALLAGKDE